jgi:hypothetical protein
VTLGDPAGAAGDGDLERVGGDVDGDGSRLHGGLLLQGARRGIAWRASRARSVRSTALSRSR